MNDDDGYNDYYDNNIEIMKIMFDLVAAGRLPTSVEILANLNSAGNAPGHHHHHHHHRHLHHGNRHHNHHQPQPQCACTLTSSSPSSSLSPFYNAPPLKTKMHCPLPEAASMEKSPKSKHTIVDNWQLARIAGS